MIFNTNSAFNVEKKDVSFLGAGIHENVEFAGIRNEKSTNGNMFIEFKFIKDGATLTQTEYEPTKFNDQTDAEFEDKANKQVARILQIMSPWYTKEQLSNFTADSFAVFAKWVTDLMSAADKSILVRLKVVYGQNGYTSLPKYSVYTFIEPMSVEKSKIAELKIDQFTRPVIGDKEEHAKSSADVFAPKAEPVVNNDLPF
jgi:hypothetical protein